jgi:hypothetical protein
MNLRVGDLGKLSKTLDGKPSLRPISSSLSSRSITHQDLLLIVGITDSYRDRYVYVLATSGAMGWIPERLFSAV